jgi:transcription antitermination protein NusB
VLADLPLDPDPYAVALVRGVHDRHEEIDALLDRFSRGWPVERMAWVDRNLLRIGAFELLGRDDVPTGVAINEAVELAKLFGTTDESPRFVNGLLAAVAREVRGEVPAAASVHVEKQPDALDPAARYVVRCHDCGWATGGVASAEVASVVGSHLGTHEDANIEVAQDS